MFGLIFWLLIAFGVLGFVGYSLNILMAQRAAWKSFAQKYKLKFVKDPGLYGAAAISGAINGRNLTIYSVTDAREQAYIRKTYVHIEVFLNTLPTAGILLSAKALPDLINDWSLPIKLPMPTGFASLQVSQTDDLEAAQTWLANKKRTQALSTFFASIGERDEALLIADGEQAFLLWRTEDAMRDVRELNAFIQKLFGYARDIDAEVKA